MKKSLLLFVIAFSLGVLTHALVFPDFLANGLTDVSHMVIPEPTPTSSNGKIAPIITQVTFDGTQFSRHNVTVQFSRYLEILNTSDKLMWLSSTNPLFTTARGYGNSEAIKTRMDKKGQFVIADKNNPDEKLVVTVK